MEGNNSNGEMKNTTIQAALQWIIGILVAMNTAALGYMLNQRDVISDKVSKLDSRVVAIEASRFTARDGFELATLITRLNSRIEQHDSKELKNYE